MADMGDPLYFDHAASSPLLTVARQAMMECLDGGPANAHAHHHKWGRAARAKLDDATETVMNALSLSPLNGGIVWTSGATEANGMALRSILNNPDRPKRLVIAATEHASVWESAKWLAGQNVDLSVLTVNQQGQIDLAALERAVASPTGLVSIMAANNETGILHPVDDIARICRAAGVPFHCDASQCLRFGSDFIPDMRNGPDMVTFSGHKAGGPPGIGILAWRGTAPPPVFHGGGQQAGLRAGTIPTALVAGFAAAFRHLLTIDNWPLHDACQRFERQVTADFPSLKIIGHDQPRLPGFTQFVCAGLLAEDIFDHCPDIAMSSGSACSSGQTGPSRILQAMSVGDDLAAGSLRLTGGHDRPSWHYELATAQLSGALAEFLD